MTGAEHEESEATDWESVARQQRRAWACTTADERLRWLEDTLTLASEAGLLERDRRRRAAAARAWGQGD